MFISAIKLTDNTIKMVFIIALCANLLRTTNITVRIITSKLAFAIFNVVACLTNLTLISDRTSVTVVNTAIKLTSSAGHRNKFETTNRNRNNNRFVLC